MLYFSGNASTKYRRAGASSPQLYTEKQSAPKDGSFMEALFHDSKNVSARPPRHSGKIALQLFPIDEEFQKSLQQVITSAFARFLCVIIVYDLVQIP